MRTKALGVSAVLFMSASGPECDIPLDHMKVSDAATVAVHAQQSVLTLTASSGPIAQ